MPLHVFQCRAAVAFAAAPVVVYAALLGRGMHQSKLSLTAEQIGWRDGCLLLLLRLLLLLLLYFVGECPVFETCKANQ